MAGIDANDFFKSKRDNSEIKSEIFNKYFKFWCGVLLYGQQYKDINEVLYIDLFSGQGYYEDKQPSTPIKILDSIIKSDGETIDLNRRVKTFFNDSHPKIISQLDKNIRELEYYDRLINKPVILNKNANRELLLELLQKGVPSLTFIDPFGYQFSMEMLLDSVKEWGSDLFMLFNVNRIRAAIVNEKVEVIMNEIFQDQLTNIRNFYEQESNPNKREAYIMEIFEKLFRDKKFLLFRFKVNFPDKDATSHYLILVTKVRLAYYRIKEIMSSYSDYQPDGVPLFACNSRQEPIFYDDLANFSIHKLKESLIEKSSLNGMQLEKIYLEHSLNTNYIKTNYKTAMQELIDEGKFTIVDPKGNQAKKLTYTCKCYKK